MKLLKAPGWDAYTLLDSGNGMRYERFGDYTVVRPDPQCIWRPHLPAEAWKADAVFQKQQNGRESWVVKTKLPDRWIMQYKAVSWYAKLSPFKHTGVFPEQHVMWDWMSQKIAKAREEDTSPVSVLNLFAYTGIASLICAQAGARVTHVDASHPTIGWARENQALSNLSEKPIRWILDDCLKFVTREVKRGVRYDGIIMDPPVFGHGPDGQRWEFFESFPKLLQQCNLVLSEKPLFFLVNAYAISASSVMLENILSDYFSDYEGTIEAGELALEEKESKRLLSTGIYGRWSRA